MLMWLLISSALPAVVLEKKDSLVKALGSSRSLSGSISRRRRISTWGHIAGGGDFYRGQCNETPSGSHAV